MGSSTHLVGNKETNKLHVEDAVCNDKPLLQDLIHMVAFLDKTVSLKSNEVNC